MVNDDVFGFAFAGKEGFDGRPEFLNVRNTFGVKVVQVFFYACCGVFTHLLLCFLKFCQFELVRNLLNLLHNFDLIIISSLRYFVMKGLLLYLILFCL